jgi:aldehyde:ferredoxin oxidoreductase
MPNRSIVQDKGFAGKILRVDLSKKKISWSPITKDLIMQFLGGRGINLKILYDEVPAGIDPLSSENKIIIGAGPLVGTLAPCSSRFNIATKSALTGILGDTNSGGHWAPELKYSGYDHLIIEGQSDQPVYIFIQDDEVEVRKAGHLWGKNTLETTTAIQSELRNGDLQVLCIGPAGEKLVRYACPVNNLTRAPARGGVGAVMGSKGLKAVVVKGTKGLGVDQPGAFRKLVEVLFQQLKDNPGARQRGIQGTPALVMLANEGGWLSYKNIQYCINDEVAEKLSAESFLKHFVMKSKGCFNCPIHCSHYYGVEEGPYAGTYSQGIEFANILCLGVKTGVDDFPTVLKANLIANQQGFDGTYLGDMIAWAMECFEKGILTEKDTDGIPLRFGNGEALLAMIDKITKREGIGDILASDIVTAASKIGKGSERYAHHIKKMTLMPDIRTGYGFALGHATSNIGAHHLRGAVMAEEAWAARGFSDEMAEKLFGTKEVKNPNNPIAKEKTVRWYEQITSLTDCLGICKFAASPYAGQNLINAEQMADLLSLATGMTFLEKDFEIVTERILALERAFNAREGISRKDDTMPPRMWEPVPEGPRKGFQFDEKCWNQALDAYYEIHGWNQNGIPTKKTLEGLGLGYAGEELEKMKII